MVITIILTKKRGKSTGIGDVGTGRATEEERNNNNKIIFHKNNNNNNIINGADGVDRVEALKLKTFLRPGIPRIL